MDRIRNAKRRNLNEGSDVLDSVYELVTLQTSAGQTASAQGQEKAMICTRCLGYSEVVRGCEIEGIIYQIVCFNCGSRTEPWYDYPDMIDSQRQPRMAGDPVRSG